MELWIFKIQMFSVQQFYEMFLIWCMAENKFSMEFATKSIHIHFKLLYVYDVHKI